ncbi:dynein intermediate chain [Coprinopsis sp. MPI-PUGE-AT-0042]|nr:dynein intermediate chain [Coprinopsis sp. MPI-PUGE-AT-0042]
MSERRRAEIEAKKAKLEELRKARAERQRQALVQESTPPPARTEDVNRFVDEILGSPRRGGRTSTAGDLTPLESLPGTPAVGARHGHAQLPGTSGSGMDSRSDFTSDRGLFSVAATQSVSSSSATDNAVEIHLTPRIYNDLVDIEQELFELPQKERVIYSKEVQTMDVDDEVPQNIEEEIKRRIMREKETVDAERIREKELEEESVKLDREIEQEIRELTEEERTSIVTAPEFLDFVEQSSKILQRALNDNYDYIRDYTIGADAGNDDLEGKRVKRVCEFFDERLGKNRSITDIDWSPKYPELSVASYNKNGSALNEPDGVVAVWNLHLLERPEFVFHSQSDVLTVTFSPFHSNLIFGGTYSGQILLWDTRVTRIPVYAMKMVGTQNAHNLITSSTDGTVCSWLVDMLAQPQETLELLHAGHNKTSEVTMAPVLGLDFHPSNGPVDFSDLFLTSSVDWTVKLWRAKGLTTKPSSSTHHLPPLYSFDEADDYVFGAKWHPVQPALFGTVDGSGKFDLWNLNVDTEVPVVSTTVGSGKGLNKLQWDKKDGRRAALGGSDGHLYIYDIGDMAIPRETEWADLQKVIGGMIPGGQANGLGSDYDASRVLGGR